MSFSLKGAAEKAAFLIQGQGVVAEAFECRDGNKGELWGVALGEHPYEVHIDHPSVQSVLVSDGDSEVCFSRSPETNLLFPEFS